jgi:hypothetical protein
MADGITAVARGSDGVIAGFAAKYGSSAVTSSTNDECSPIEAFRIKHGMSKPSSPIEEFRRKFGAIASTTAELEDEANQSPRELDFDDRIACRSAQLADAATGMERVVQLDAGTNTDEEEVIDFNFGTPTPVPLADVATDTNDLEPPMDRRLRKIVQQIKREYIFAVSKGRELEIFTREKFKGEVFEDVCPVIDMRHLATPGENDEVFIGTVRDESKMVGWRKLKNGITMDSGSAVDITPETRTQSLR